LPELERAIGFGKIFKPVFICCNKAVQVKGMLFIVINLNIDLSSVADGNGIP